MPGGREQAKVSAGLLSLRVRMTARRMMRARRAAIRRTGEREGGEGMVELATAKRRKGRRDDGHYCNS